MAICRHFDAEKTNPNKANLLAPGTVWGWLNGSNLWQLAPDFFPEQFGQLFYAGAGNRRDGVDRLRQFFG